ncbi:MAG: hypothetical protein R3E89_09710 [Thiolinea sp.]
MKQIITTVLLLTSGPVLACDYTPTTTDQLYNNLALAIPGQQICLQNHQFTTDNRGPFTLPSGISLIGPGILEGAGISNGYIVYCDGCQNTLLAGISIRNGQKALSTIMLITM